MVVVHIVIHGITDQVNNPSALSAGTYIVTVTDSWGCTETLSVSVGDASPITTNNPSEQK